jgi:uncharacterized protein
MSNDEVEYSQTQSDAETQPPVEIPPEALSTEAFQGIIDNYILREGTDYGAHEVSHEAKVKQIEAQIKRGDVKIVFDPASETVSLVTKKDFKNFPRGP